jgi:hypothetical protein
MSHPSQSWKSTVNAHHQAIISQRQADAKELEATWSFIMASLDGESTKQDATVEDGKLRLCWDRQEVCTLSVVHSEYLITTPDAAEKRTTTRADAVTAMARQMAQAMDADRRRLKAVA